MIFLFKSKKINLDCFTSLRSNINLFPIDYTHKFFPDWWKELPREYVAKEYEKGLDPLLMPTMKSCLGFTKYYNRGITIPLWSDLRVDVVKNPLKFRWEMSDEMTYEGSSHDIQQMTGYLDPLRYGHLKITPLWILSCKEDIDWVWTHNTWSTDKFDFMIPPGILNFKYAGGVAINMFFSLLEQRTLRLNAGQPLINLLPMSDRKVKIHLHEVSNEEYMKLSNRDRVYTYGRNKYKNNKAFMQKNESKCPFGFK